MTMREQHKPFACDDVQAVLSGLLDGELDAESRHLAEVHLAHCEACRTMIDEAEQLDREVRSAVSAREAWSEDFERRIHAAVNDPAREWRTMRRLRFSAWAGWVTAVAAMVLLAASISIEFQRLSAGPNRDTFAADSKGDDASSSLAKNENRPAGDAARPNDDEEANPFRNRISPGALPPPPSSNGETEQGDRDSAGAVDGDEGEGESAADDASMMVADARHAGAEDEARNARPNETQGESQNPPRREAGAPFAASAPDSGFDDAAPAREERPAIDMMRDYERVNRTLVAFRPDRRAADASLEAAPASMDGSVDDSITREESADERPSIEPEPEPLVGPNRLAAQDADQPARLRNRNASDHAAPAPDGAMERGDADEAPPGDRRPPLDGVGHDEGARSAAIARAASIESSDDRRDDFERDKPWRSDTDDILYSTAILLRLLEGAEVNSFEEVREINQILEYDDVLDRLAASRDDVDGEDAVLVDQAWAALEWVYGPVDQDHLRRVQNMIARNQLPDQLEALSDKYATY